MTCHGTVRSKEGRTIAFDEMLHHFDRKNMWMTADKDASRIDVKSRRRQDIFFERTTSALLELQMTWRRHGHSVRTQEKLHDPRTFVCLDLDRHGTRYDTTGGSGTPCRELRCQQEFSCQESLEQEEMEDKDEDTSERTSRSGSTVKLQDVKHVL